MTPNWLREPLRQPACGFVDNAARCPQPHPPQKRSIDVLQRPVKLTRQQQYRPKAVEMERDGTAWRVVAAATVVIALCALALLLRHNIQRVHGKAHLILFVFVLSGEICEHIAEIRIALSFIEPLEITFEPCFHDHLLLTSQSAGGRGSNIRMSPI